MTTDKAVNHACALPANAGFECAEHSKAVTDARSKGELLESVAKLADAGLLTKKQEELAQDKIEARFADARKVERVIIKHFDTMAKAATYQNRLYNQWESVKLIAWPMFTESGEYRWDVA